LLGAGSHEWIKLEIWFRLDSRLSTLVNVKEMIGCMHRFKLTTIQEGSRCDSAPLEDHGEASREYLPALMRPDRQGACHAG